MAAMKKYFPASAPSAVWSEGWASCTIFLEGFKRMTDSGAKPTRAGLLTALDSMDNFSNSYVQGISYKAKADVKEPHLVRPMDVVGKWDVTDQTMKVVKSFTQVPKVPGWAGQ